MDRLSIRSSALTSSPKSVVLRYIKLACLLIVWIAFTSSLIVNNEHSNSTVLINLAKDKDFVKKISGDDLPPFNLMSVELSGALKEAHKTQDDGQTMKVGIRYGDKDDSANQWIVGVDDNTESGKWLKVKNVFKLKPDVSEFSIVFSTKSESSLPLSVSLDPNVPPLTTSVTLAFFVLIGLYVMIIWEIVDRTFAALIASTTAISIMGWLHMRPSMETIINWIDVETIILLFGMMILVAILSESGVFDYVAVLAYRITRGHPWPLIFVLCIFTGLLSAFLDNVTMVLLMTPVTIRLCEIMGLHVQNVLISVVIFSNIGGTMTAVGDPPNVIIASNKFLAAHGVTFMNFMGHMMPVIIVLLVTTMFHLRLQLGKAGIQAPEETDADMARMVKAWQHAAHGTGGFTEKEIEIREAMKEKIKALQEKYKEKKIQKSLFLSPVENFTQTLAEMEVKYPIRDKVLLIKSAVALVFAILMFFLHSVPSMHGISLPWAALLSAFLLLILASVGDISNVLFHVEWATLLFFAALFVLMEALSELGLIEFIGELTINVIAAVDSKGRLAVAIILILWITALTSAFVDNIPITTMMVKLVIRVYHDDKLKLPLTPLVWALALGACLGGNGTLIGASANVVCAGVAEQHGYRFSFFDWFKIGFPVMLGTLLISTVYLLLCHALGSWQ